MATQNRIYEIGLRQLGFVGCSLGKFFIIVRDDNLLVFIWKCPGTHVAVITPSTKYVTRFSELRTARGARESSSSPPWVWPV
jgi:hypothetical protein